MANPKINTLANTPLPIPLWEFVSLMAAILALNALAIDTMLPALERIASFYQVADANDQQWVIFAYVLGFSFPQLIFGPITDAYGRKALLLICLAGFSVAGALCMMAPSFQMLLIMRFIQGMFAAGTRVIAGAVIRDLTSGRVMARILSLVFTVFMIVPILAPSIGTLVMLALDWKWTFGVLAVGGALVFVWTAFRLPFTLPDDARTPLSFTSVGRAYWTVLNTPVALGYMLASGIVFGALFTFIGASEQIFDEVYGVGDRFWLWFAVVSSFLAVANFTNSKIVERFGMRRISHTVLFLFIAFCGLNFLIQYIGGENFVVFLLLFSLSFACFGMMGANFASLALEPLGKIAGSANALYGFATSGISAMLGILIASQFDGSIYPILIGFVGLGLTSLLVVSITERGKLFGVGEGKEHPADVFE